MGSGVFPGESSEDFRRGLRMPTRTLRRSGRDWLASGLHDVDPHRSTTKVAITFCSGVVPPIPPSKPRMPQAGSRPRRLRHLPIVSNT
jgi:hypothetical protein